MALVDKQQLFTTMIINNMKERERTVMRDGMAQFAEPTQRIVKQAVAVHFMKSLKIPGITG